jgi:hypothetical protein
MLSVQLPMLLFDKWNLIGTLDLLTHPERTQMVIKRREKLEVQRTKINTESRNNWGYAHTAMYDDVDEFFD